MLTSSCALFDFRELRREVDGVLESLSMFDALGCGRELSVGFPLLRPPLLRFEDEAADFSSVESDVGLLSISVGLFGGGFVRTDPVDDMAALPLAFLGRFRA